MTAHTQAADGPNFAGGIGLAALEDRTLLRGHVDGTPALAVREGDDLHFVGAVCSHYGLPLEDGLVTDGEIHCPHHHARFCLRNGAATGAPALDDIPHWHAENRDGIFYATARTTPEIPITLTHRSAKVGDGNRTSQAAGNARTTSATAFKSQSAHPARVVIVGGGAAGHAAAEMLRAEGHRGTITLLSADTDAPYDRPACSKAFLAGKADAASVPLRDSEYYRSHDIDVRLDAAVTRLDTRAKTVAVGGEKIEYDTLLLATGATPNKLDVPGSDAPHVHTLRTFADAKTLAAACAHAKQAVVVGASFIGLEAAASLRARGLAVHVVSPTPLPMEKLLGKPVSDALIDLHRSHGVTFEFDETVTTIASDHVTLKSGKTLAADLIVVGIGVTPRTALAREAGLTVDDGIVVDDHLRTSAPDVYAAGDVARWPDPFGGRSLRVEHWVVAQRQGQAVARTMLGSPTPFREAPFFWSMQYDFSLGYVGHVDQWDRVEADGDLDKRDWTMTYFSNGEPRALALVNRKLAGVEMEAELEKRMAELAP